MGRESVVAPPTASRSPLPINGAGEEIWAALFRHGVLGLRLAPEAFWHLSWREWRMLTETPEMAVLSRQALEDLMREFPDE